MAKTPAKVSRRDMLKVMGFAAGAATLAACAPAAAPTAKTGEVAPTTAPEAAAAKKFTILHWAQGAEPTDPNTQLAEGQVPHVAYQTIADEYMKMNPNVDIEWYRFPAGSQFAEWLLARMTAQDAPDIYWANTEDLWPHINKGWALDFTPYMNQPNPYVAGNTSWKDQFQDVAIILADRPGRQAVRREHGRRRRDDGLQQGSLRQGRHRQGSQNLDRVHGCLAEASGRRLHPVWRRPVARHVLLPALAVGSVYNQLVWDNIYNWDDDKNKVISGKELVNHFQKGDFMDWDAYLKMAHLFKDMVPFFPRVTKAN